MKIMSFISRITLMNMIIIIFSLVIFITFINGMLNHDINNIITNYSFPNSAKNVTSLGNGWFTFELETNGKTHKFLFRKPNSGGSSDPEIITELKD